MPSDQREVLWFVRADVGVGGSGLLPNNRLLDEVGYARTKLWLTIDGAWMLGRWVGVGLFAGYNLRTSRPSQRTPGLEAWSAFAGAEVPFAVWGDRDFTVQLTPRLGVAAGAVDSEDDSNPRPTGVFGGALNLQSFTYHVGATLGWLMAPGEAGELGPTHDFGGLYGAITGSFDG